MGRSAATVAGPTQTVLHVSRLGLQDQATPVGADQHLTFRAWAAEHGGGGRGLPSSPLPVGHDQHVVDGLEWAGVPPQARPEEDGAFGQQIRTQEPLGNAAALHVEDFGGISRVDQAGVIPGRAAQAGAARSEPIGHGQIGFVTQAVATIRPPGGRGPHCGSRAGFNTLLES
jgi:hypothetical protein